MYPVLYNFHSCHRNVACGYGACHRRMILNKFLLRETNSQAIMYSEVLQLDIS